jgi:hypothetical protein
MTEAKQSDSDNGRNGAMKNITKPVWLVFDKFGEAWGPYPSRQRARAKSSPGEKIIKYIPAPVTPKAKPAPKAVSVLTDWIPCETPPVRVGVYERNLGDGHGFVFQRWAGEHWCSICLSADVAARDVVRSNYQGGHYRGFTTPQQ